ncbi:hypothetical protein BDY19DRAFT_385165 [Irpex rosettiformis]|uniref:Uncharacterized protein n=1 Tax=Irpex rosettiformis TaxID=378272 RepID=A0ACB8TV96_9APHY|nr:hypothetical protein BDY19DRAFT_385165 [Irpex rosettiformis]
MMSLPTNLMPLLETALNTFDILDSPEEEDEFIEKLRFFLDDNLILAALDLVDRDSVILYNTPWKHTKYEVLGTTSTYSVFLGRPDKTSLHTAYCTCPSFAYSVLASDTQYMCKHLLATVLAIRMSKCTKRVVSPNELAGKIMSGLSTT